MTLIQPNKEIPTPKCPFCESGLEFMISESFTSAELTFKCLKCKKQIVVSKI